jgi:uncharacterized phage protein (TIGR01671 family)
MREIKFRAWLKAESVMCTIKVITFGEGAFLVGAEPGADRYSSEGKLIIRVPTEGRFCYSGEFELMQFTGLKDKNGVEIYEGDIMFCEDHRWVVSWNYDSWDMLNGDWSVRSEDFFDDPGITVWEESLVIGNIYENPDLL